jgi:hypothetical protein
MADFADKKLGWKWDISAEKFYAIEANSKVWKTPATGSKLEKWYEQYKHLPGFAEGIAEAVQKGLSGMASDIASKISGALGSIATDISNALSKIPGFDALKTALGTLQQKLGEFVDKIVAAFPWLFPGEGGNGGDGTNGATPTMSTGDISTGDIKGYRSKDDPSKTLTPSQWASLGEDQKAHYERYARGATFKTGGRFRGEVHAPEEIIPQATSIKGPGIIARALEALDVSTKSSRSSESSNSKTEIHIHNSNDFSGSKVSNDYDLEKLFRQIDKRIESVSVEAVKKQLGQRRN